jgi:hypothetical protein
MIELTHHSLPISFSFLHFYLIPSHTLPPTPKPFISFLSPFKKEQFPILLFLIPKVLCILSYTIQMMMVEKEDLGLSLSLNFFQNTPKQPQPLNPISSSPYFHPQQTITPSGMCSSILPSLDLAKIISFILVINKSLFFRFVT